MKLIDNKAVHITVSKQVGLQITSNIDKSEIIKEYNNGLVDVLIKWDIQEMTYLNRLVNFKSPLPSPIKKHYDWPGLYKPFDHQQITSEFLSLNPKAFCFNEAGTGKTSSVLLKERQLLRETLILLL